MSGTENSPAGILDEHLRLGAGFAAADRPRILGALAALAPHLSGWKHDQVDLEVSRKDTEGKDKKVTLQVWLAGRAHLVATSHERDLDDALAEVRRDLIRQIADEKSRREPSQRLKTRSIATRRTLRFAVIILASTADPAPLRRHRHTTEGMPVGRPRDSRQMRAFAGGHPPPVGQSSRAREDSHSPGLRQRRAQVSGEHGRGIVGNAVKVGDRVRHGRGHARARQRDPHQVQRV